MGRRSGRDAGGVFIPRRDTDSVFNQLVGGKVFPGEHHAARFRVEAYGERINFEVKSKDGEVAVEIRGRVAAELPAASGFGTLAEASKFFEPGSLGYSVTGDAARLDGLTLKTKTWKVEALDVEHVFSSYFADETKTLFKGQRGF